MNKIILALKGVATGITVTVPGADSGTMLIILKLFDKVLAAINLNLKKLRENLPFIIPLLLGVLLGIVIGAVVLSWLFKTYTIAVQLFFIGIIIGSLPIIKGECTKNSKLKLIDIIPVIIGFAVMFCTWRFLGDEETRTVADITFVSAIGMVLAAFVAGFCGLIPGASGATILKVTGFWSLAMNSISELNIPVIALFGVGIVAGVLISAKVMTVLLQKYRKPMYCILIGFILASIPGIFPHELSFNAEGIVGIILMAAAMPIPLTIEKIERSKSRNDSIA